MKSYFPCHHSDQYMLVNDSGHHLALPHRQCSQRRNQNISILLSTVTHCLHKMAWALKINNDPTKCELESCLYHVDVRYRLQNLRQRMIDTTGGNGSTAGAGGSGVTGGGASTVRNGTNRGGSMTMYRQFWRIGQWPRVWEVCRQGHASLGQWHWLVSAAVHYAVGGLCSAGLCSMFVPSRFFVHQY